MEDQIIKLINRLVYFFFFILLLPVFYFYGPVLIEKLTAPEEVVENVEPDENTNTEDIVELTLEKGTIDPENGLIVDDNYKLVEQNCSACHSLKLVTQNRATEEGWKEIIVWMQETQKLWDLGENEPKIITYLGKNYAPNKKGRRQNLKNIEWYEL